MRGINLLRQSTKNQGWLQQPAGDLEIFKRHSTIGANWRWCSHKLEECDCWSHSYDRRASYLAVTAGVQLGVGEYHFYPNTLSLASPELLDHPGLWFIQVEPDDFWLPSPAPYGASWQYTPVVKYLVEKHYLVKPLVAYLFSEHHQVLRGFYEHVKPLYLWDKQQGKDLYTHTLGMLAHAPEHPWPGMLYRPDWWSTIVSEAKARLYRAMWRIWEEEGKTPVRIHEDCLFYPEQVHCLPMGPGPGQYKENKRDATQVTAPRSQGMQSSPDRDTSLVADQVSSDRTGSTERVSRPSARRRRGLSSRLPEHPGF